MEILLLDTQQLVLESEFRAMYPNTSFPQLLVKEILDSFNAVALVDNEAWATYRQSLRDITGHTNFPYNIGYPVNPA